MMFTVLGGHGFIGQYLINHLRGIGFECYSPVRPLDGKLEKPLGHVIYCIGLTADFRSRAFDAVDAHVCLVSRILKNSSFESFTYLSSARVYRRCVKGEENASLTVDPADPDDLYNITKLAGESVCLSQARTEVRVVRLSNVYGYDPKSDNFLSAVINEAIYDKSITLRLHPDSAKDYVSVSDVVGIIPKIALYGKCRMYNVASSERVTNRDIVGKVSQLLGSKVAMSESSEKIVFPEVSIEALRHEFDFKPARLIDDLHGIVNRYQTGI